MSTHPFETLTPNHVINAVERLGILSDACMLALSSYENRVYRVSVENSEPIVIKFYRPNRWNKSQIQEELDYLTELQNESLPVAAPVCINNQSLFSDEYFHYAIFTLKRGRAPDFSIDKTLHRIGRQLAQFHNLASQNSFTHRQVLAIKEDIEKSMQNLLHSSLMPDDYKPLYESLYNEIPEQVANCLEGICYNPIRVHGDLHQGNLIDDEHSIFMLDFDDCKTGPAMQDIWMLLHGSMDEQKHQLQVIKAGYEELAHFPMDQLVLIEPLRTLRIVQHVAWINQRWDDPAFPIAFPWFESHRFWSEHLMQLREQSACLSEPNPFYQ